MKQKPFTKALKGLTFLEEENILNFNNRNQGLISQ